MSADAVSAPAALSKTAPAPAPEAAASPVPADPGTDTDMVEVGGVRGAVAEVRAVLSLRGAVSGLLSGSWVLAGMGCGCVGRLLSWAWEQASLDPEGQAAAQAHAKKVAKVRAKWAKRARSEEAEEAGEGEEEAELEALGPAPSGRRPVHESLAYLALGGLLVAGGAATAGALITPYLHLLAPWKPVIVSVGGAAWTVAAWIVAPPPKPAETEEAEDQEEEHGQDDDDVVDDADRGTALLWHVVRALADAESAGRAGLHLDVVLDSAVEAGLLAEGTEVAELRSWVEGCGLPTEDKVGMRIGGKPTTRVGMKIGRVTETLGTSPAALLRARSAPPAGGPAGTPAGPVGETPGQTPADPPGEAPAEAPGQTPAGVPGPAAPGPVPGGSAAPLEAPSPALSQETAQGAR
ncbi:hypothetical protein [Streptomyces sp. NPDC056045]|uniref:hypothetical protein n=1 Tax=Streptomyces sp. NPDC056045 TaxID=3345691 RepID=UPI0035DA2BA0